jgi:Pentapeptide repeats (8 copies)
MQLLISRKGNGSIYSDLDLSERDLNGVELIKANLNGADLTGSNLQNADLTLANLTNVKAGNTDFSDTTLTGACIQNWTINSETKFDGLVCEHIFLTPDRDPQNRRPLSGSFEPGDFELLVEKFTDTLDFILRRGTDPAAFKQALSQLQRDNPTAAIEAMVNLDADRVLVQATVPEGADKVKLYESFQVTIQLQAQKIGYLEATVDDKTRMIDLLINKPAPPIQLLQANHPTGPLMPDNRTQTQVGGDNISVGDNNQGVVGKDLQGVAGRDISGTLTLSLAALSATDDPKAKALAELITQLKTAIEAPDSELEARHKTRALEYLDNLTKLAQTKPENHLKTAKENLDDLADIAEKGSKLATFAAKYLPPFTAGVAGLRLWFGI